MLIRSQDKTVLTNFANVTDIMIDCIEENKFEISAFFTNHTKTKLGNYSTEEKAIKVLDMIESFYSNFKFCEIWGIDMTKFYDAIFQMPQDDEVKV